MSERTCSVEGCEKPARKRGWCAMHYERWRQHGDVHRGFRSPEQRFWEKVDRNGPTPAHRPDLGPCWIWTASVRKDGYGQFDTSAAHIAGYRMLVGPVPEGKELHHQCETKLCVRPDHLVPLTDAEHAAAHRPTHCIHGHEFTPETTRIDPRGSRHCRICDRAASAKRSAARAARRLAELGYDPGALSRKHVNQH